MTRRGLLTGLFGFALTVHARPLRNVITERIRRPSKVPSSGYEKTAAGDGVVYAYFARGADGSFSIAFLDEPERMDQRPVDAWVDEVRSWGRHVG